MSRQPVSVSQRFGLSIQLLLGAYGVAAFVKMGLDDMLSYVISFDIGDTLPLAIEASIYAVVALMAVLALIALISSNRRMAKIVGVVDVALVILGLVGEARGAIILQTQYSIGYGNTFNSYWPSGSFYYLSTLLVLLVAAILCTISSSHTTVGSNRTGWASMAPVPPPLPRAAQTTHDMTFFVQVEGQEYGPYTDADVLSFVREGRVTQETMIRPDNGYYERAGLVPGLFPS